MTKTLRRLSLAAFLGLTPPQAATAALHDNAAPRGMQTPLTLAFSGKADFPNLSGCKNEIVEFDVTFLLEVNRFLGQVNNVARDMGLNDRRLMRAEFRTLPPKRQNRLLWRLQKPFTSAYDAGTERGLNHLMAHPSHVMGVISDYKIFLRGLETAPNKDLRTLARDLRPSFVAIEEHTKKILPEIIESGKCERMLQLR